MEEEKELVVRLQYILHLNEAANHPGAKAHVSVQENDTSSHNVFGTLLSCNATDHVILRSRCCIICELSKYERSLHGQEGGGVDVVAQLSDLFLVDWSSFIPCLLNSIDMGGKWLI